jgi:hypothetical protein
MPAFLKYPPETTAAITERPIVPIYRFNTQIAQQLLPQLSAPRCLLQIKNNLPLSIDDY